MIISTAFEKFLICGFNFPIHYRPCKKSFFLSVFFLKKKFFFRLHLEITKVFRFSFVFVKRKIRSFPGFFCFLSFIFCFFSLTSRTGTSSLYYLTCVSKSKLPKHGKQFMPCKDFSVSLQNPLLVILLTIILNFCFNLNLNILINANFFLK